MLSQNTIDALFAAQEMNLLGAGDASGESLIEIEHAPRPFQSPIASDDLLRCYAGKALLSIGEAVAIVQGFTPPIPEYGDDKIYYLDDHATSVKRLQADCTQGRMAMPCRPLELEKWAATVDILLPPAFLQEVGKSKNPSMSPTAAPLQAAVKTISIGYCPEEQRIANRVAEDLRGKLRRSPTKPEVYREAKNQGLTQRSEGDFVRRITNQWSPRARKLGCRPKLEFGRSGRSP